MRFPDWLFWAIYYTSPVWSLVLAFVSAPLVLVDRLRSAPNHCELKLG